MQAAARVDHDIISHTRNMVRIAKPQTELSGCQKNLCTGIHHQVYLGLILPCRGEEGV